MQKMDLSNVKINKISEKDNVGIFAFEPLPLGFGYTLGNSLRRVLLTTLEGAAITQVKISGVQHQFATIPGVKEDVVELTLNFKQVLVKVYGDNPVVARISKKGAGTVTAGDIEPSSDFEILNKELHLATLSEKDAKFEVELVIEPGVGYLPVEDRESSKIGVILLDAMFSPVLKANYTVEPTRMGRTTGLDKLIVTIETDGSISPSDALTTASTILRDFFHRFTAGPDKIVEEPMVTEEIEEISGAEDVAVEELALPTRTINALKKSGIESLRQLAARSDDELADIKNLGDKSVQEIKKLLAKEGLR